MSDLVDMIWVEGRKAIRSRMPLWLSLGSLFLPLSVAFLIFVARNPDISRKLGLISAKADLLAYSATDWRTFLGLTGQLIAIGGFFLFILAVSWTFGREFADGTLKDMLAVPVRRGSIVLAKFITATIWSVVLSLVMILLSLVMGAIIGLPGGSTAVILQGAALVSLAAAMSIATALPFAFFASIGRGYLLPLGIAVLTLLLTNVLAVAGWGEYFPWAVPGLYAQGQSPLTPISYWIVVWTGLAGMIATYLWCKYADQHH